MKTKKLIQRLKALFDRGVAENREAQNALREVLEQLKKKERKLQAELEHAQDPKRRTELERKIALVHSQRSKGLQLLKQQAKADAPPAS